MKNKIKKILLTTPIILLLFSISIVIAQQYLWRYRTHATDCTSLTDGKATDLCYEQSTQKCYKCQPISGDCDTPSEWKQLITADYAQVITVAKSGAAFTTIQEAINSITDATTTKRYCIKIQSGIYTESITMKDYVDIQGAGRTNTIIFGTSGTVLTFSGIHCTVMDIGIEVNYGNLTANSQAIVSSGADSTFLRCSIIVTKSSGDKLITALAVSGGSFRLDSCYFAYSITGATTNSALVQTAISHTGDSTIFLLHSNEIVMTCNDINDEVVGFATISGSVGNWLLENNIISLTTVNIATGLWLYGTATGATISRNRITLNALTTYGLYIDSNAGGAIVDTRHNEIISSGIASYSAYVDTGDTWNSSFDKIISVSGYTGSLGTVNLTSSPSNGNFTSNGIISSKINDVIIVDGVKYLKTSTGIQAAINALPVGGGEVFLPAGTYTISALINIPSKVIIQGAGMSTYLKLNDSVNPVGTTGSELGILQNSDPSGGNEGIIIRDLYIDGNRAGNTLGDYNCITLHKTTNSTIQNVWATGANRAVAISGHGIAIYNDCDGIIITGNHVFDTKRDGIDIIGGVGGTISNNDVHDTDNSGIQLSYGTTDCKITNNTVYNEGNNGIVLDEASYNIISNNNTYDNTTAGIWLLNDSSNNSFIGNQCNNNQYGLMMTGESGSCDYNTFNSEVYTGNTIDGVQFRSTDAASTNTKFIGCNVSSNTTYGFNINKSTVIDTQIINCTLHDNGKPLYDVGVNTTFQNSENTKSQYDLANKILNIVTATSLKGLWVWNTPTTSEIDLSGNSHSLTPNALISFSDVFFQGTEKVVDFNGYNDTGAEYFTAADHNDFSYGDSSNDSAFSIFSWAYFDASDASRYIISKRIDTTGAEDREWRFGTGSTAGKLAFTSYDESTNAYFLVRQNTALTTGWHFVAVTYDGTGGALAGNGVIMYVDGSLVASTATNNANYVATENGAATVTISGYIHTTGVMDYTYNHKMGVVGVTKEVLSASQVWKLYIATRGNYNQ